MRRSWIFLNPGGHKPSFDAAALRSASRGVLECTPVLLDRLEHDAAGRLQIPRGVLESITVRVDY